ncbi:MAG TPA: hypothetical protein VF771_12305 [Longimicrobiaceae bacterium]
MKKLKIEDLTVESFEAGSERLRVLGTVHARESQDQGTFEATCLVEFGCWQTGDASDCSTDGDTCSCADQTCDFSCQWGWHDTCH